jgi:hypothetical protein
MTADKRSYTAGHFELLIDGLRSTAFLKSVDGGFVRQSLVDEPIGPYNMRVKHTSTVDIEPLAIDFGLADANSVLKWIQSSWARSWCRRSGQITHGDFNHKATFEHHFYNALITETTFPALDGASKDAAYLKLKFQPEKVVVNKVNGQPLKGAISPKQKMWACSGFRLNLEHIKGLEYTNKIESFTIKQGVKKFYTGNDRFPQIEPTKIDFPNILGTISEQYAGGLLDWYNKTVIDGQNDPSAQTSGSIDFLAPTRDKVLFRINLYEVGLLHLGMVASTAKSDQIKRMKFELYVGRMDIDGKGMGFE